VSGPRDARITGAELAPLLAQEEGQFLEFKSLWDRSTATPSSLDRRQARFLKTEGVRRGARYLPVLSFGDASSGERVMGLAKALRHRS
jgi:hypothetical protein